MKYGITIVAAVVAIVVTGCSTTFAVQKAYEEYMRTSEELLWALEEMCEQNNLSWGDTICETDQWSDYCEARKNLGLNYFKHYSKK